MKPSPACGQSGGVSRESNVAMVTVTRDMQFSNGCLVTVTALFKERNGHNSFVGKGKY